MVAAAVVGAVGAVAAGGIAASGAQSAAKTQANAARDAAAQQYQMYDQTRSDLLPWQQAGQQALGQLQTLTGTNPGGNPLTAQLTKPFEPTMQQLEQTPGYQFVLDQSLKSVQNAYAAKGLATSGAALKGAANFASGLASATFQQQFQNYLGQNQQIYNMLSGISQQGENAAAQTGQIGQGEAATAGQLTAQAGTAQAAGTVGAANALTQGLQSASNYAALYALTNGGMYGKEQTSWPGQAQGTPSSSLILGGFTP